MLSYEQMLKTLASLGLTETDSEIYLLLCVMGPQRGKNIAEELNLVKQQLNKSLTRLQKKGMVSSTFECPPRFLALPLEKILAFLIETKKEQALALQQSKEELLSTWRSVIGKSTENS